MEWEVEREEPDASGGGWDVVAEEPEAAPAPKAAPRPQSSTVSPRWAAAGVELPSAAQPADSVQSVRRLDNAIAAKQPRDMAPPRDRREAIDDAVDRIEMGAPSDQVFAAFEKAGIKRDEIIARGNALGGKAFAPDTREVTVREGARDGSLSSWAPTDLEGVANFGTRVGQQAKQAFVGGLASSGVLPASIAAPALAASSKKAAAAMPGEDYQRGLEELSGATTFGEAFSAIARNPGATGLVVAESAALFVPVLAAAASVGLPAVGLAGVTGGFSAALEFGSALTEVLSDKGVSAMDPVAIEAALNNPEIMAEARKKGAIRGLTVGAMDALSAGMAGKFLAPVVNAAKAGKLTTQQAARQVAIASAKEVGMQAGAGSGGEALAQGFTGEFKPFDIVAEGLGEVALAPLEVRSNLAEARLAAQRAAAVPRVEDMPTTPFTPEQIAAIAPAPPAAAPGARPAAGTSAPMTGPGAAAPIGVAATPQGSLADLADQALRGGNVQPNVAAPAQPSLGAADAGGNQPGGGVGAVRPVPAEPGQVLPAAAAPTAGAAPDRAAVPAGVPRPALDEQPAATPIKEGAFATRGEALAFTANEGMGRKVDIVETPDGGFALQPRTRPATEQTQQEDQRELEGLNAAIAKQGWANDDGSPVAVRAVPDKQAPPGFSAAAGAVEAAFGVRVVPVAGTPGSGIQFGRRAYVNVEQSTTQEMAIGVTGHESLHWLEQNDPKSAAAFYKGMAEFLRPDAVAKQLGFENANLTPGEAQMTEEGARSEVMANINGSMWVDSKFWERLYDLDSGSTFRKVLYSFMKHASRLARVVAGGQFDVRRYVTDANGAREVAAKVWAERARNKNSSPLPTELPARTAQKRADKRMPGESDKAFAKRAVDVRDAPTELPEKPDRYFKRPAGTQDMKISRLISSKSDADNKQGGDNGAKRMMAAAKGELSKRAPVTVMPSEKVPGSFEVVDGNGTLTTVKRYGWSKLPVIVVTREEGQAAIAEDKRKDAIKKGGWVLFDKDTGTKGIPRADMPQVSRELRPRLYEYLKEKFGIETSYVKDVPASSLKPTQAEFSRKKVDELLSKPAAPASESESRMHVLMSKDGFILDGHHRTEARREDGGTVDGMRFSANLDELMGAVWAFPFTKVNMESEGLLIPAAPRPKLSAERLKKIEKFAEDAKGSASDKTIAAAVDTVKRFEGVPAVDIPVDTRARLEGMLKPLLEQAAKDNPIYDKLLFEVAQANGWRPLPAPTKSLNRSVEKMYEDERWHPNKAQADKTWLKDAVRGSIVVRDETEVGTAIEAVQKAFKVTRIKDRFDSPLPSGYRDILINVELPSGQIGELQIHIPQMLAAKELGHMLFEIERAMESGADKVRLAQAQRALYSSAYDLAEATKRSNSERGIKTPSLATRPDDTSLPVQPDKQRPSGSITAGLPSTSAKDVPSGKSASDQFIGSSPSDRSILPRQARKGSASGTPEQGAETPAKAPKKRLRPGQRLHANLPDPKIGERIAKKLGLTPQELAATSLPLATGKGKGDAFSLPAVGGLPSTVAELTRRRTESGLPELDTSKPEDQAILAKLMAAETLAAINAEGSAVEWYDATINRMLAMASVKYPELERDQEARNSFIVAMAITSQGLNVENNLGFAMRQYEAYRESSQDPEQRRFPIASEGKNGKPMENNFKVANGLIERMGLDSFRRLLRTDFTVGELKKAGWKIGGEKIDEKVLGSSVFGPKIGFGFYTNLSGNFEPVTMDMWFMRTVGRLANTLRSFDAKKFKGQTDRFMAGLEQSGNDALYADQLDPEMVEAAKAQVPQTDTETGEELLNADGTPVMGPDGDAIEALARDVNKRHQAEFKNRRAEFDAKTRVKSEIVKASETILKSLDKPRDSPASGGERQNLREVVRQTVALVEKAYGKRIPPAALQALIWYPEQELYRNHGVSLNVTSQDYAGAIRKRLESEGFDGQQLTAAESRSREVRGVAGRPVGQGAEREAGQAGGPVQLTEEERRGFLDATTPAPKVRAGKGPKQSRARYASDDVALEAGYAPGDYTALEGRTVERSITLDDGKVATLKMDAAQALRAHDARIDALQKLRACLKGAA